MAIEVQSGRHSTKVFWFFDTQVLSFIFKRRIGERTWKITIFSILSDSLRCSVWCIDRFFIMQVLISSNNCWAKFVWTEKPVE